jgi:glycosyltransferase involved in cell wall biosynthesis
MFTVELSIIIPVIRFASEEERAVRSVISQIGENMEIVIVDDGSMPPLQIPIELSEDQRIIVVRNHKNKGPAGARNAGILAAKGKWLAFLDSDDWLLPRTLMARFNSAKAYAARSDGKLLIHGCAFVDVDHLGMPSRVRTPREACELYAFASGCWFCPGSCVIIERQPFLDRVGPQDENLRRLEDLDWFLRAAHAGAALVIHPIIGAAIQSSRFNSVEAVFAAADVIEANWCGRDLPAGAKMRLSSYLHLEKAAVLAKRGNILKAGLHFLQSWVFCPRISVQLSPGWTVRAFRDLGIDLR